MMRFFAASLVAVSTTVASAGDAPFRPYLAEVTGLALGDHLNIRSEPSGKSEDLGDLAMGAQVEVTALTDNPNWVRILYYEGDAYVSVRYLKAATASKGAFGAEAPLACIGTEPFWAMTLGQDAPNMTFETPDAPNQRFDLVATNGDLNAAPYKADFFAKGALVSVKAAFCSDGMSDRSYGWDAQITLGDRKLLGCCMLQGTP